MLNILSVHINVMPTLPAIKLLMKPASLLLMQIYRNPPCGVFVEGCKLIEWSEVIKQPKR